MKILCRFFIFLLLVAAFGCGSGPSAPDQWHAPNGKLKVFCTIAMIEAIVNEVGGPYVDAKTLISGQLDPHSYQIVKGDDENLQSADLIFYNGLGLEHGPSLQNFLSKSPKAFSVGRFLKEMFPEKILHYHDSIDPHVWMDVSLWAHSASYIGKMLAERDPQHAAEYRARALECEQDLLSLHEKLFASMQAIPPEKRYLITSHDAFRYFTRAYLAEPAERVDGGWEERFIAPEGLAPESQISTADIRRTLERIEKYRIRVIFPESNVSQASIRKLVDAGKKMGLPIRVVEEPLYGDAMGPPNALGNKYAAMIKYNIETVAKWIGPDDGTRKNL